MTMRKGQVNSNAVAGMVMIIVAATLGIVSITMYDSIEGSLSNGLSGTTNDAATTMNNYTENVYDGFDLVSNLPILLGAGILLAIIVAFGVYVRS